MSEHDRNRRRKQVLLGVVGLAAVLGAGAYVITAQVLDHRNATTTSDTGALAPMITPASATPPVDLSSAPPATSSASASVSAAPPSAAPSPSRSSSVDEQIRKAREKAAIRPNLLLCWRTSADRSVATVLVDQKGKPSAAESVQIINREWAKLG